MALAARVEQLSRRGRELSPDQFATWLIGEVARIHQVVDVAALWVRDDSPYFVLCGFNTWPQSRNARVYPGPFPIVAHPPCGPWGKYSARCVYQSRDDGIAAMALVHRFGGVVEQPVGSQLFRLHGRPGARITQVNQCDWGHPATKATLLYWVDCGEFPHNTDG